MARKSSKVIRKVINNRKQAQNPVTNNWVKFDTSTGRIISHKRTPGPYKRIKKS